ncbi:MAG: SMC-Scp complex subunit ScpB [Vampirovibrio sp.]|nr:SMC-Scp complex subunit ScpB [Vampirovibrio sp.]
MAAKKKTKKSEEDTTLETTPEVSQDDDFWQEDLTEANKAVELTDQEDATDDPEPALLHDEIIEEGLAEETESTQKTKPESEESVGPGGIDVERLKGKIEAALFITSRPLTARELAEIMDVNSEDAEVALMELINDYAFRPGTALEINDDDGYILQVREDFNEVMHKMMPVEISHAAVRTLSAIAIKAPVLQSELIELRGSNAYEHIHELLGLNLISKKRKGRSYLLNTTKSFHQYFKLTGEKKELENLVRRASKNSSRPRIQQSTDIEDANLDDLTDIAANEPDDFQLEETAS